MNRVFSHLRGHCVGYLALVFALTGTAYGQLTLPAGSVGARQLRNHTLQPIKLDPRYIGAYVRAWVGVNSAGRDIASSRGVRVGAETSVSPGRYIITWRARPTSACRALGSVDLSGIDGQPTPGYVLVDAFSSPGRGEQSIAQTYDAQGVPAPLPYDVELICSTPR